MRQFVRSAFRYFYEGTLLGAFVLVLRPSADILPRAWACGVARLMAVAVALSPIQGRAAYSTMRQAFRYSRLRALVTAQQWLARPIVDFVILRRVIRGREDFNAWKVIETGNEAFSTLRESGRPFIIATGHFARESHLAIFLPRIIPHRIAAVAAPPPPLSRRPLAIRRRLHYCQILDALHRVRPEGLSVEFTGGFSSRLDKWLKQPGNVVIISADAYWKGGGAYTDDSLSLPPRDSKGVHLRPFIGHLSYPIATGTAFLSRLAQCPIVPCVTFMPGDRTIAIQWGDPIAPPVQNDKDADTRMTDRLLVDIERAVGLRPSQYVLEIGCSRRWNSSAAQWDSIT